MVLLEKLWFRVVVVVIIVMSGVFDTVTIVTTRELFGFAFKLHQHYTVLIAPDVSPTHRDVILKSLNNWHREANASFLVSVTTASCWGDACIQVSEVDSEDQLGQGSSSCNVTDDKPLAGCTSHFWFNHFNAIHVKVLRDANLDWAREQLYNHELGHALGLRHVTTNDVMREVYDHDKHLGSADITCGDVQQYRAIRHQPVSACAVN